MIMIIFIIITIIITIIIILIRIIIIIILIMIIIIIILIMIIIIMMMMMMVMMVNIYRKSCSFPFKHGWKITPCHVDYGRLHLSSCSYASTMGSWGKIWELGWKT